MPVVTKTSLLSENVFQSVAREVTGELVLEQPSKVALDLTPNDVVSMVRDGSDLLIETVNGETLRIVEFYPTSEAGLSELYLVDEQGGTLLADLAPATGETVSVEQYVPQNQSASFDLVTEAATSAAGGGGAAGSTLVGGLAATGVGVTAVGAAVAATESSDSSGDGEPAGDETAPTAPTLEAVTDDVGDVTGALGRGDSTDDATPTVSGTTEAGATVQVYDGDTLLGSTTANATGEWAFTSEAPLAEGGHNLSAAAVDPAGNVSAPSPVFTLTVDTTAPDTPTIEPTGGALLTGTAEASSEVNIDIGSDGSVDYRVDVDAEGNWSMTLEPVPSDGTRISVTATDSAGNTGAAASVVVDESLIDTTPPEAPLIISVIDDVGDSTGNLGSGESTDDATPTLSGTAEAGATVQVYDGDTQIGEVVAAGDGSWSLTLADALAEGAHSFTAVAVDAADNASAASPAFGVAVDTAAPAVPSLDAVTDDVGDLTGDLASGGRTDDTQPLLSGTAEAGVTVNLYDGDTLVGSTTADAEGNWSVAPDAALAEGAHSLTVTAVDAAGNASGPGTAFALTVDTRAQNAPTLDGVSDDVGTITGDLASDDSTDDATPTLSGTAEAGVTVQVYDGDTLLGSTVADGVGNWAFTPEAGLADGDHRFTAVAVDAAGNASGPSGTVEVTVDTQAPVVPTLDSVADDVGGITGELSRGDSTDDTRPLISGTAEAGATVQVYDGDTQIGEVVAAGDGSWSLTLADVLAEGAHSFTAVAVDAAGNASAASPAFGVTVDTAAPGVPTVNPTDGSLLSGTAEASSEVNVDIGDNGSVDYRVDVDAEGHWSVALDPVPNDGAQISVTVTDPAGNTGAAVVVVVDESLEDTTPPQAPLIVSVSDDVGSVQTPLSSGDSTDDIRPLLVGTAEAGSIVRVSIDGAVDGTTMADAEGNWRYEPSAGLTEGEHSFTAVSEDAAGNVSLVSAPFSLEVDLSAPANVPVVNDVSDDTGPDIGSLAGGDTTDDVSPTLSGTAVEGASVNLYDIGVLVASASVDAEGNWSVAPDASLAEGAHSLTVTAVDAAGNESGPSAAFALTVDTVAPAIPTLATVTDDVGTITGELSRGDSTDDTRPLISGTAEAGATVQVYDGDTQIGEVVAAGDGSWSLTLADVLAEGAHSFTAVAVDAAGNASAASPAFGVTVDTAAPAVPMLASVSDDVGSITGNLVSGDRADDSQPLLSGTAEAGATVNLYDGDTLVGSTTADAEGNWSVAPDTALAEGAHSLTVTAVDAAGNESGPSAAFELTVDTVAPAIPTLATVSDDVGTITGDLASGESTDDATPTLSGAGGVPNGVVNLYNGGVLLGSADVDAGGEWRFTPESPLLEGDYSITATSVDAAGNESPASAPVEFSIDTTAPGAPTMALASDTGAADGDSITNDGTVMVTGLEGDASWQFSTDGGTTWADGNGTGFSLAEGDYANGDVLVRQTDPAGNTSAAGSLGAVTVDVSVTTPAIVSASDDFGPITASLTSGAPTDDTTPTLVGTAEAGSTVTLYLDGVEWDSVTADATGNWSYTPAAMAEGDYSVTARSIDVAGNPSSASEPFILDITSLSVTDESASLSEQPLGDVATGTASGQFTIDDVAGETIALSLLAPNEVLNANGETINWSGSGTQTLIGSTATVGEVLRVVIDDTGAYTVTLSHAIDHPQANVADGLDVDVTVEATDGTTTSSGVLSLGIEDSVPVATPSTQFTIDAPQTLNGAFVDSFGSDGGFVEQVKIGGYTYLYDPGGDTVTQSGNSELVYDFTYANGILTVQTLRGETLTVDLETGDYSFEVTGIPVVDPEANVAPEVGVREQGGLLGIAGANALGLIDLSQQQLFTATDANNDISRVVLDYDPLLGVDLDLLNQAGLRTWAYSADLADELGLDVDLVVDDVVIDLVLAQVQVTDSARLTITSQDGGPIDGFKLNEFLGSVTLTGGLLSADLLDDVSITATDTEGGSGSDSVSGLLGTELLPDLLSTPPEEVQHGDENANTLDGGVGSDRLYGHGSDDVLNGDSGSDILRGGAGSDTLDGGGDGDILVGGGGDDDLTGGTGVDVFRWETGNQGSSGTPAVDTIGEFDVAGLSQGGDILDLRDLLQGEGRLGVHPGNIANYLHFEQVAEGTLMHVSSSGGFQGGFTLAAVDQQILLEGVDLTEGASDDQAVIADLLERGKLLVDEATTDTDMLGGNTDIDAVISDNDGDTAGVSVDVDASGASDPAPEDNQAPDVQADATALLGLVGVDVLNLIDLSSQDLTVFDRDDNLRRVELEYAPLLAANLDPLRLTASEALAAELGLKISITHDEGLLDLVAPRSMLTITSLDGGNIDNLSINELLATVHFTDGTGSLLPSELLSLDVLNATTIIATDAQGAEASDAVGTLVDANVLNSLDDTPDYIQEGGAGDDTLTGTAGHDRLYGYEGSDTLIGNGGGDILRAGLGDDRLEIADDDFVLLDGGDGFDTLALDDGVELSLGGGAGIGNIERIDLGSNATGDTLTLTEEAVLELTDEDNELQISGDSNDTLNIDAGWTQGGQFDVGGASYTAYTLGDASLLVQDEITVNTEAT